MTLIIGISGKKQSGKSSLAKFIQAHLFKNRHPDDYDFVQNPEGKIEWRMLASDFDFFKVKEPDAVGRECKIYSFADPLKQDVCMKVLGLTHEQCYGTDEEKNSLTKYKWDRFDEIVRLSFAVKKKNGFPVSRSGFMTAREVLQVVGTEIFRKYFSQDVWVEATLNTIKEKAPEIALIPDVRFRSEVEGIWSQGGYIIRLNRQLFQDSHASEVDLDDYDFEAVVRCIEIHNSTSTIEAKNDLAISALETILIKEKLDVERQSCPTREQVSP